ncbi:3'-5' exonuclease [Flavobacterium jejuense]|uniref:3'-5' exonuclease n=1 Tax=Flavobacterium jejuense TaxID=1544455 RepID=A0ABX0IPP7_9FLAO|nr:3'-5' exonuclease [Flavobacterium jejuense]NHN25799.1 3'-5' exonuclease [Flavobacterium jejuense]
MKWPFKNIIKEYPSFWIEYLAYFNIKTNPKRYVVFDCETTGLDIKEDRILSIGAVAIVNNKIVVNDYYEVFISQTVFKATSVHIHGILKDGNEEKLTEREAIITFLNFIKSATLIGHHISFDIEIINEALNRLDAGRLKNQYMDTDIMYQKLKHFPDEQHTSLDELCDVFKIRKTDRHTSSGDAYLTALLFLKLKRKLDI